MKEIRELILSSLASLSHTIDNSKSYIRLYSRDVELQNRAEDLYITILEAVEGITHWLGHKSHGEFPVHDALVTDVDMSQSSLSRFFSSKAVMEDHCKRRLQPTYRPKQRYSTNVFKFASTLTS